MNDSLNQRQTTTTNESLRRLLPFIQSEFRLLAIACLAMVANTGLTLMGPALTAYAIDHYIAGHDLQGLLKCCGLILILYAIAGLLTYFQSVWVGGVGQTLLFRLRQSLFEKIQQLSFSFFQGHKSGDLISRLNNDTDKINQFFSQALMQFLGGLMLMSGCAFFLLAWHPWLGLSALLPALGLVLLTRILSPWTRTRNADNLSGIGRLSAEIAESLENFKVVVAFGRQDYFRQRFAQANLANYRTSLWAGITNGLHAPAYTFCGQLAQLFVLFYGLRLVAAGQLTVGILIGYLVYVVRFYEPVRQMASSWTTFQAAMAAWERIYLILGLQSDLEVMEKSHQPEISSAILEFREVKFAYVAQQIILDKVSFCLQAGRTYALVGPTGGGKSTTAALIARLFDPDYGKILLDGCDLRSFSAEERSRKIGFILQEPFLQAGSLRDNFSYANPEYRDELILEMGLHALLAGFAQGLETDVSSLSLGQKQIVAFIRAVLRRPQILILDEATANIDTVTEQALSVILAQLPQETTRVIIAHRLNTIAGADQVFFVHRGLIKSAGNMAEAVHLLREAARIS